MYNMNVNMSNPPLLNVESIVCTQATPRTPEILNSLIAMTTNPLDSSFSSNSNNQFMLSNDSRSSCSESPLDSPAGNSVTPSVQQTCSQLIKSGLRLSLQMKRKHSSGDSSGTEYVGGKQAKCEPEEETTDDDCDQKSPKTGLTPEDEDRRRRRRERNKIAATKCRMKKRERTMNLVIESEQLETQNIDLRSQVRTLESERRKLIEMLQAHGSICQHPDGFQLPPHLFQLTIACKYLNDALGSNSSSEMTSANNSPIPSVSTLKTGQGRKSRNSYSNQNGKHASITSSRNIGNKVDHQIVQNLPSICCKQSPVDLDYTMASMATMIPNDFLKVAGSLEAAVVQHHQRLKNCEPSNNMELKADYIPNCEPNDLIDCTGGVQLDNTIGGTVGEFILKTELIDTNSPYTNANSADTFLFDDTGETTFDCTNVTGTLKNNNNTVSNNNNLSGNHPMLELNEHCGTLDGTGGLIKTHDYLTTTPNDYLAFNDPTDTQFTDLDSGVTSYMNITNNGCLA